MRLDFSRATVMRRVARPTARHRLHRDVLCNDNVEPPLWTVFTDPEHIVRLTNQHNAQQRLSGPLIHATQPARLR